MNCCILKTSNIKKENVSCKNCKFYRKVFWNGLKKCRCTF